MLLWRTWRETPCTPRRRFARLTCKFARTRRCYHTKKPVPTCVSTGLTCMLYGARSLHALTCMFCGASSPHPRLALAARARARFSRLHACRASSPRPQAALTRSARRRPWRHAQRTAAPARERSHQRPEPHGRCARPRQDGFRLRSEALQSHRPSRHNHRSCAQG